MAEVMPFAGTRYATKEKGFSLAEVVCPPYDEISTAQQKELHERHPFNIVRIISGNSAPSDDDANNRYSRAQACYRDWKEKGVLDDEQRKCFYVYEQEFKAEGFDKPLKRLGFFALVKLQDFRSGKTRAFEATFDSPKADRLKLIRTVQINDSPLHVTYRDPEGEIDKELRASIDKTPPIEEFTTPDGIKHRLWMVHKKEPILAIHKAMQPKKLVIADGHHRYETALKYRDEMREMTSRRDGRQPWDFCLMFMQRAEDDTLLAAPIHRVLARELSLEGDVSEVIEDLEESFHVSEFKANLKDLEKAAATITEKIKPNRQYKTRFAMTMPDGRSWVLSLKKETEVGDLIDEETMSDELKHNDIIILHRYVITRGWIGNPDVELGEDDILYRKDMKEALELLQRRKGCVAFFLNPMAKEEVLAVAERGELLPHQSVTFFPKIPCGLVLRDHNVGFG